MSGHQYTPEEDRQLLALRRQGKSYDEISVLMGIPRTSLKSHHYDLTRRAAREAERAKERAELMARMKKRDCLCCRKTFPSENGVYWLCPTCRTQSNLDYVTPAYGRF